MGEAFTAIEFETENAEIAAIGRERQEIATAIAKADARRSDIAKRRREFKPDGKAVADALLAAGDASKAAGASPSLDQMQADSDALGAAMST
jgi:hypothetical protein